MWIFCSYVGHAIHVRKLASRYLLLLLGPILSLFTSFSKKERKWTMRGYVCHKQRKNSISVPLRNSVWANSAESMASKYIQSAHPWGQKTLKVSQYLFVLCSAFGLSCLNSLTELATSSGISILQFLCQIDLRSDKSTPTLCWLVTVYLVFLFLLLRSHFLLVLISLFYVVITLFLLSL